MSLQIWLPFLGNLNNNGLKTDLIFSLSGSIYDSNGKIGQCLNINNEGYQRAYGVTCSNNNLVELLGTEYSCAVWAKPLGNHIHYNGTIMSSGNWNGKCWAFGVNQDNTKVDVFGPHYNKYINCSVPVNTWTHLACSVSNGVGTLYKNGEYVGQITLSQAELKSDASYFCIGRETYASGYFGFNGELNDLRVYDHALSAKEVKELSKGLVLHYKLDGNPNLINKNTLTEGVYFNNNNGGTGSSQYWAITDYIPIQAGKTYIANHTSSAGSGTHFIIYDTNKNVVRGIEQTANTDTTVTANTGEYYIRLSIRVWTDRAESNFKEAITAIYDCSGYRYDGEAISTVRTYADAPRYLNSSYFAGATAGVYTESNLSPIFNDSFTISFWVKSVSENGARSVYFGNYDSWPSFNFEKNANNYVRFWWKPTSASATDIVLTGATVLDDSWTHITVVRTINTNLKCYINGELKVTNTTTLSSGNFVNTWRIARDSRGDATSYHGYMSDFRIYATALSAEDVKELYQTSASIDNKGNLFAYEFVEE